MTSAQRNESVKLGRTANGDDTDFVVSSDGEQWHRLRDLGAAVEDTAAAIAAWDDICDAVKETAMAPGELDGELLCPVVRPSKMLAIGLNYADHITETGAERPDRPIVFAKYPNSLTGPYEPVVVDERLTEQADYEVELAVIVGRRARWVEAAEVQDYVFGYAVANDVSARDWQRADTQFSRSKSMDTFCPVGPWITTADEVLDPQSLPIRSIVNGEVRQELTTEHMIFKIGELVEFLSRTMSLEPGDVILTGTPPGVGFAMDPPRYLVPGDRVRCEIDGLGAIENDIVGPDASGS